MARGISRKASLVFTKYVGTIKTKPQSQQHLSLGSYSNDHPAKGFSIVLNPTVKEQETVTTEIVPTGTPNRYAYTLHITNNGAKTVSAEVWTI